MVPFTNNPDLVGEAQGLLISQFQDKPRVNGIVEAIVEPLQDVQDTLYAMLTQTYVTNAVGAQLDIIGEYVGITRGGYPDDLFRLFIQVQIGINNSQGHANEILAIVGLITGATNVLYIPGFPAGMSLQVNINLPAYLASLPLTGAEFIQLIQKTIPAGVALYGISWYDGPGTAFGWESDPDALGFGTITDPSLGGDWASLI